MDHVVALGVGDAYIVGVGVSEQGCIREPVEVSLNFLITRLTNALRTALYGRLRGIRPLGDRKREPRSSLADVFSEVYRRNMWGGNPGEFYSGPGSDDEYSQPFADVVNAFISEHEITSVVDLGCGDYRTGRLIARSGISYIGVDVVESLIERNNRLFANDGISFRCADIIEDSLPDGDLCILRQVLQHLSNAQVTSILARLNRYRWAIVGAHHPAPYRLNRPNLDRPAAFDTRVESDSGLFLECPPFSVRNGTVLAQLPLPYLVAPGEKLTVYLIDFATDAR